MRRMSQSDLAWGEGDSVAAGVVVAVCGIYTRNIATLKAVRCSRWVLELSVSR
jgi:hypothetical protein